MHPEYDDKRLKCEINIALKKPPEGLIMTS